MKGVIGGLKQKDKFRYAEKCLYSYKRNLAGLEVLREDLRVAKISYDVKAQNYQYQFGFTGEVSDPVSGRLIRIENIQERIKKLERLTVPITRMIEDLNSPYVLDGSKNKEMLQILNLLYLGNNQIDIVIEKLKIAKRTFFNRRSELVKFAIDYLAL